jgi:hypothetical protein
MTRSELKPFLPTRTRGPEGNTMKAVYSHFCEGLSVADAAIAAGISRQRAERAIGPIRRAVLDAGYTIIRKERILYVKE